MIILKEDLEKLKSKSDLENSFKILSIIKKKQMTIELLRATLFGKSISSLLQKLKKDAGNKSSDDCAFLCEEILKNWKDVFQTEKKKQLKA